MKSKTKISLGPMALDKEIDYIVKSAKQGIMRVVAFPKLILFSIPQGDAWMLDTEDGYAMQLAHDGVPSIRKVRHSEDDGWIVDWPGRFELDDAGNLAIIDRQGVVTFPEAPTQLVLNAIEQMQTEDAQETRQE